MEYPLDSNGDLNLEGLKVALAVEGNIHVSDNVWLGITQLGDLLTQVIDPKNFRPFFEYVPGVLRCHDVHDLLDHNYLRMIGKSECDQQPMNELTKPKYNQLGERGKNCRALTYTTQVDVHCIPDHDLNHP